MMPKITGFFNSLYRKLFKINDTPQKIALGFGLGVAAGIFPGTGPIAALFLAFIFRANRASALIGSLATNTWLSFVTFILAAKAGTLIFNWLNLGKLTLVKAILPVAIGYLLVALFLGLFSYLMTLLIIWKIKKGGGNAN